MVRRSAAALVVVVLAILHLVALLAPAIVLAVTAEKGGVPGLRGLDLVAASAVLGVIYTVVVGRRLRVALRSGRDLVNTCIAAFDSLVVLALTATLLLIGVLGGLAAQHAVLINRGWPVLVLWLGVQAAAIALAEVVRIRVLRWLRAERRDDPPAQLSS